MIFPIYWGERITVRLEGQTWRGEKCEHCGQRFYYPVTFKAAGITSNPFYSDRQGNTELAVKEAQSRLEYALNREVFPVLCPHCTKYQGYMLRAVRSKKFQGMRVVALGLFGLTLAMLCIAWFLTSLTNGQSGDALATALLLALVFMVSGIALFIVQLRMQARFDPNSPKHANYRRLTAQLAMKPEEFERLGIAAVPFDSPGQRRPQLVGQKCVRCGDRIPYDLDGRYCQGCGRPVHNRCAMPGEGAACSACGAESPAIGGT